jgi:hypothetical protein
MPHGPSSPVTNRFGVVWLGRIFVVRFMDDLIEPEASTRRGLLHAFARAAARRARERNDLMRLAGLEDASDSGLAPTAPATPTRSPARVPARVASLDELLAVAHAEGLTQRDDELRTLARRSLRMTPIEVGEADAWIRTSDDRATAGDEVLQALINLAATSVQDCGLPGEGWLALFLEPGDGLPQSEARRAHGVVVDMPAAISDAAEPVVLHPELVLPRRWHEAVQALDLDDSEAEAYDRLRTRVQDLQGVERDADGGPLIAYHRLLGYPNETTGKMPGDCIDALRHWSVANGPEPASVDWALPPREWQLLAQVSLHEGRRTYVWIRQSDLEAGEFETLCAFVR